MNTNTISSRHHLLFSIKARMAQNVIDSGFVSVCLLRATASHIWIRLNLNVRSFVALVFAGQNDIVEKKRKI